MRDSSRFHCHHRVWVQSWPGQWQSIVLSDRDIVHKIWWYMIWLIGDRGVKNQRGEPALMSRPGLVLCPLCFASLVNTHCSQSHVICSSSESGHFLSLLLMNTVSVEFKWTMSGEESPGFCVTPLSLWSAEWRVGPGPDNPSHREIIDRRELTVCLLSEVNTSNENYHQQQC